MAKENILKHEGKGNYLSGITCIFLFLFLAFRYNSLIMFIIAINGYLHHLAFQNNQTIRKIDILWNIFCVMYFCINMFYHVDLIFNFVTLFAIISWFILYNNGFYEKKNLSGAILHIYCIQLPLFIAAIIGFEYQKKYGTIIPYF